MNDANKKLDELLKKEWHKNFRIISIAIATILILLMGVIAYSTGDAVEIESEVITLHSQASEYGEYFYIIAKLDSGRIVKLEAPRETAVKKGDKVILKERKTNLFGFKRYSFYKVRK